MTIQSKTYDSDEEFWNVLTHGIGLVLSIIATIFLVKSNLKLTNWHVLSYSIYGASLILLYFAFLLSFKCQFSDIYIFFQA